MSPAENGMSEIFTPPTMLLSRPTHCQPSCQGQHVHQGRPMAVLVGSKRKSAPKCRCFQAFMPISKQGSLTFCTWSHQDFVHTMSCTRRQDVILHTLKFWKANFLSRHISSGVTLKCSFVEPPSVNDDLWRSLRWSLVAGSDVNFAVFVKMLCSASNFQFKYSSFVFLSVTERALKSWAHLAS